MSSASKTYMFTEFEWFFIRLANNTYIILCKAYWRPFWIFFESCDNGCLFNQNVVEMCISNKIYTEHAKLYVVLKKKMWPFWIQDGCQRGIWKKWNQLKFKSLCHKNSKTYISTKSEWFCIRYSNNSFIILCKPYWQPFWIFFRILW